MKTKAGLQVAFSSLTLAFCMTVIGGNVVAQTLPSSSELLARATAKSYPRTIDVAALKSGIDYEGRWASVQYVVKQQYSQILSSEPLTANARLVAQTEGAKTTLAAAVWLRTGSPAAASEAKRRALNIASWSPSGTTGYLSNDQAGRSVARTLALAYDWLYGQWTPDEKAKLRAAIRPRVVDILSNAKPYGLNNGFTLDSDIYNGHAANTAGFMSVICTVLAGEELLYDRCLVDIVPRYLSKPTVWGGDDGGFANGTAYAHWAFLSSEFLHWPFLKEAVGVDMWQTLWAKNYINYIAYFLPPGAPSGVFGDETEIKYGGVWATQGKAYAGHLPSPLANWYARNQYGEYKDDLALLLTPKQNMNAISSALPSGTAHGIHIPSIGWAAMHSDLGNPLRTSVYFKSSPYGSFNHSHADQNSFVIHAGGQSLAIDSGYYDSYGSPHWKGWYKATRAHNAITFDGGQGQMYETMTAKGTITQFEHTPEYDLVTGDASLAYGGGLTKAVRSMVYLRPNTLVIFDSLESRTPRTWEWNIHALSKMGTLAGSVRHFLIDQAGVKLCVRMFVAPDGNVALSQTDQFTVAPQGIYPNQWHGRFSSLVKSTTARFVTVLEVGCSWTPVQVEHAGDSHYVTVLGNTLSFDGNTVTVR